MLGKKVLGVGIALGGLLRGGGCVENAGQAGGLVARDEDCDKVCRPSFCTADVLLKGSATRLTYVCDPPTSSVTQTKTVVVTVTRDTTTTPTTTVSVPKTASETHGKTTVQDSSVHTVTQTSYVKSKSILQPSATSATSVKTDDVPSVVISTWDSKVPISAPVTDLPITQSDPCFPSCLVSHSASTEEKTTTTHETNTTTTTIRSTIKLSPSPILPDPTVSFETLKPSGTHGIFPPIPVANSTGLSGTNVVSGTATAYLRVRSESAPGVGASSLAATSTEGYVIFPASTVSVIERHSSTFIQQIPSQTSINTSIQTSVPASQLPVTASIDTAIHTSFPASSLGTSNNVPATTSMAIHTESGAPHPSFPNSTEHAPILQTSWGPASSISYSSGFSLPYPNGTEAMPIVPPTLGPSAGLSSSGLPSASSNTTAPSGSIATTYPTSHLPTGTPTTSGTPTPTGGAESMGKVSFMVLFGGVLVAVFAI